MTAAPAGLFDAALAAYRGGDYFGAMRGLEACLAIDQTHGAAWHLLGVLRHNGRDLVGAEAALARAVVLVPGDREAWINLAHVQAAQLSWRGAATSLERALALAPGANEWSALAKARAMLRDATGQRLALEASLVLEPNQPQAAADLAALLLGNNRLPEGVAWLNRAIALAPEEPAYHRQMADAARLAGDLPTALKAARRAAELAPQSGAAQAALANAAFADRQYGEARRLADLALGLDPLLPMAHLARGLVAHHSEGPAASLAHFRRAIALDPEFADAHWNLGFALIRMGHYPEGYAEYEWRRCSSLFVAEPLAHRPRRLLPSAFAGKRVWLQAEQGLGDIIQHLRYAPLVADQRGKVTVSVPEAFVPMAKSLRGVDRVIAREAGPPEHDLAVSLLSLPFVFGTRLDSVPRRIPYLSAQAARLARWREKLSGLPRPRIGIAWRGSKAYQSDGLRSIDLTLLAPTIRAIQGSWVSLLTAKDKPEIAAAGLEDRLIDFTDEADRDGAFLDTAAIMTHLDLVISVDTSIAHVAGAMGLNLWILLSEPSDPRWLIERKDSPWYPTARLFRQNGSGDWTPVLTELRQALGAWQRL